MTPPADIRPYGERNDFLQSSVGEDRANRWQDVATAGRVLVETGDLSRNDAALQGDMTPASPKAIMNLQARGAATNPDNKIDGILGPQTLALALEHELPKARAKRATGTSSPPNLLIPVEQRRPFTPLPVPDRETVNQLVQNVIKKRTSEANRALSVSTGEAQLQEALPATAVVPDIEENKILSGEESNTHLFGSPADDELLDVTTSQPNSLSMKAPPPPLQELTSNADPAPATEKPPTAVESSFSATDHLEHIAYNIHFIRDRTATVAALDNAANALAKSVDRADMEAMDERSAYWRRRLRSAINADGSALDMAEWKEIRADIAEAELRREANREAFGVNLARNGDGGFQLKTDGGQDLISLPPIAGAAITKAPDRHGLPFAGA